MSQNNNNKYKAKDVCDALLNSLNPFAVAEVRINILASSRIATAHHSLGQMLHPCQKYKSLWGAIKMCSGLCLPSDHVPWPHAAEPLMLLLISGPNIYGFNFQILGTALLELTLPYCLNLFMGVSLDTLLSIFVLTKF